MKHWHLATDNHGGYLHERQVIRFQTIMMTMKMEKGSEEKTQKKKDREK